MKRLPNGGLPALKRDTHLYIDGFDIDIDHAAFLDMALNAFNRLEAVSEVHVDDRFGPDYVVYRRASQYVIQVYHLDKTTWTVKRHPLSGDNRIYPMQTEQPRKGRPVKQGTKAC